MMPKSWVLNLGYDSHSQKTRSRRGMPLLRNKRMHQLVLLLFALFATQALSKRAADPKDDPLGEVVDEEPDYNDGPQNPAGTELAPVLPFTEKDQRTRAQLMEKYPTYESLNLEIASIEPEAGPMNGATRVLVRGGPFKDMALLYPRPKCKFGRNDKIVDAAYVHCRESPTAMDELEGHHANRVSIFFPITL